jgi:hypothetical protein
MRTRPDKTLCFLPRGGGGEGDESTASWGAKVSGFGCCMLTKGLFFGRETIHRHRRAQGFFARGGGTTTTQTFLWIV